MLHTLSLVVALLTIAAMNLLIKAGARLMEAQQAGANQSLLSMAKMVLTNPWIIGGMICGILNFAAYTFALKKFPVSTAYPIMTSVSYVIVALGAMVWFSERLKTVQIVGMVLILAGVWMVASAMVKTA